MKYVEHYINLDGAALKIKEVLASLPLIRYLSLSLLKMNARDITIKNHWTGDQVHLNSFFHKSYWYFGKSREFLTMQMFGRYIKPGMTVIEVGGHIGYISQYFSHLVGKSGRVFVFEPGNNNTSYIERNCVNLSNVYIIKKAISDINGVTSFYLDNVTGQNNSLLSDYITADSTAESHLVKLERNQIQVDVITLDKFCQDNNITPDFIKIDIEGCDLLALKGATNTLKKVRSMMVEVTYDQFEISKILKLNNFIIHDENGVEYNHIPENFIGNIFVSKKEYSDLIE